MAKTRDQMVTIVADAIGKSASAIAISGAQLGDRCIDFLNWGQERIGRSYNFDELDVIQESAATVIGVKRYPMITGTNNLGLIRPKDVTSIKLIDLENSWKLERWTDRDFDKKFPRPENFSEGRPTLYIRWGMNLELFRIPDAAYSLYFRYPQWASDLSSGSSTSDYQYKDQLLISAAILEGYLHFAEYEDAKAWLSLFIGRLSDAIKVEGDTDWEPSAQEFSLNRGGYISGQPWLDPYAGSDSPLSGYPQ